MTFSAISWPRATSKADFTYTYGRKSCFFGRFFLPFVLWRVGVTMQVIISGKQDPLKLLAASDSRQDIIYKPAFQVLRRNTDDGTLLCSTLTGALVLLSSEESALIDRLPGTVPPGYSDLVRHRFIVPATCRETETVDQLRTIMLMRRGTRQIITRYNILPTTYCNARCFYCYESGIRQVHMSDDTADRLVQFIAAHHGNEAVKLAWFGGEPTLGRRLIDRICGALVDLDIAFQSSMTSNGYLFDPQLVKHAVTAWQLKTIQITLDGTRDIYNSTKAYVGVSDDPYDRVLNNISSLAAAGVHVDIRLNLDDHNADDLATLVDELSDRFPERTHLKMYISRLDDGVGPAPIAHEPDDEQRLDRRLIDLQRRLEKKGWPQYAYTKLPCLRMTSCMADDPCAVQCTPEGILGKCEDVIYEHTVGSLDDGIVDQDTLHWWQERRPFAAFAACPLYPSCDRLLRHCPVKTTPCTAHDKARRIARYHELMLEAYRDWKRGAR